MHSIVQRILNEVLPAEELEVAWRVGGTKVKPLRCTTEEANQGVGACTHFYSEQHGTSRPEDVGPLRLFGRFGEIRWRH